MEINWTKTDNLAKGAIFQELGESTEARQTAQHSMEEGKKKKKKTHTQQKVERMRSLGAKNGARTGGRWEGEPGRK